VSAHDLSLSMAPFILTAIWACCYIVWGSADEATHRQSQKWVVIHPIWEECMGWDYAARVGRGGGNPFDR